MKKQPLQLYIHTGDSENIVVCLKSKHHTWQKTASHKHMKAQMVLPVIDRLLSTSKHSIQEITQIHLYTGPGSYTGLRVGASVAQMLSYILHVPINSKDPGTSMRLHYA